MNRNKVLIIGPAWVGDMMMAQSLFKLLKQQNPGLEIDVLAPNWTFPLLSRMPEVDKGIVSPFKHGEFNLRKRYQIGKELRSHHYGQAIVLKNSFKSALIPCFAEIPKRTGWLTELRFGLLNDGRWLNKTKYPLMVERYLALGLKKGEPLPSPFPIPKFEIKKDDLDKALKKHALKKPKEPILALCPGAEFGPSKRWPASYFAEVANEMLDRNWQVWLFGSKNDIDATDIIMEKTDHRCVDLAGKTDLSEAIDLLSLATSVVSNDSGLMHIAAALDLPMVAVYGSTSTKFTPPLNDKVKILQLDLECSPCFKRECPLGHWKCMLDLRPEMVLKEIKE